MFKCSESFRSRICMLASNIELLVRKWSNNKNKFCGGEILAKKQKQQQVFSPTVENTLEQLNTGFIQNTAFLPGWKIYEPAEPVHGRCFIFLFDNRRARTDARSGDFLRENRGSVNRIRRS